jgi:peptide/nickel transport system permease protein
MILSIPFLIMGSLLVETYFGIPGLGDLTLTSINDRNEPIMSGMVFLTALIYTVGVLITDLSYALFDPRIRLS